jgi:hypothetical protein
MDTKTKNEIKNYLVTNVGNNRYFHFVSLLDGILAYQLKTTVFKSDIEIKTVIKFSCKSKVTARMKGLEILNITDLTFLQIEVFTYDFVNDIEPLKEKINFN